MENETVRKFDKNIMIFMVCLIFSNNSRAEPIYHKKYYPDGSSPFPVVIALHTSGGFRTVQHLIQRYVNDGFAVYAPDFFTKHGHTLRTKMETFSTYRKSIEKELSEIIDLVKNDPKIKKLFSPLDSLMEDFGLVT